VRPTLFKEGVEFQDFVCVELAKRSGVIVQNLGSKRYQLAIGENIQGFEIKLDTLFLKTNRLSIEVAEKSKAENAEWVPSGIYRNDNTWLYIQGNYEQFFVFQKNLLQKWRRKYDPEICESHGTVQKFYLPLSTARELAALVVGVVQT
jgi:hypothetical protein